MSSPMLKNEVLFHNTLPEIINNLITGPKLSLLPEVASWVKEFVEYNLKRGKHTRGLMTTLAYEMLENPDNISDENRKLSVVLGWCLEMVQGSFCIQGDIFDCSITRRRSPCWYTKSNVGIGAVNDYLLMMCCVSETLEIYFLNTPHFVELIRLFHKTIFYTSMGQHVDFTMSHHDERDYSQFTMDRYKNEIVPYKNCFFTFKLPLLLALTLVKDVDMASYDGMDEVCDKLSVIYQMQDDYIDCFGDEAVTGKAGTDIQEGKCTWLAVTALERCNQKQRNLFTKHYASRNPVHVAAIKKLYADLELKELYLQTEVKMYDDTVRLIQELSSKALAEYFFILIEIIYKRDR